MSRFKIAIIGMAGVFPGANDINVFWDNLCNGVKSIKTIKHNELISSGVPPSLLDNPNYISREGVIDNLEYFDAQLFKIAPKEAELMDPQQRIFLECVWRALENAGYNPFNVSGNVGVYCGSATSSYFLRNILNNPSLNNPIDNLSIRLGNDKDFLSTKVSYFFDFTGPSVNVQTACSTSLVAVHTAARALLCGECDMAVAGAIAINGSKHYGYLCDNGGMLSKDGHCRPFDKKASGTIFGSGCGVIILKCLEDAIKEKDNILAIIQGSSINNDGRGRAGYTAPNVMKQSDNITKALKLANFDPKTISYIETHGTATVVGDPIEFQAFKQVFKNLGKEKFCALGSVKGNIGHLDTASGMAGLLKTILMLQNRKLVPSVNFTDANPLLDITNTPFYINTRLKEWKTQYHDLPLRAGINSLGMGGTNAFLVLEEAQLSKKHRSFKLPNLKNNVLPYTFQKKYYWISNNAIRNENVSNEPLNFSSVTDVFFDCCSEVVGVNSISLNNEIEKFVDSLTYLQLIDTLEQKLKLPLSLSNTYSYKTFGLLLRYILSVKCPEVRSYVKLNNAHSKHKLFLFHPVGGTISCYLKLARSLGDKVELYAFQDRSIEVGREIYSNICEMAEDYLSIIKKIQPNGPYFLGGLSFGGTLAFEITRQLEQNNSSANIILMFDSWAVCPKEHNDKQKLFNILTRQLHTNLQPHKKCQKMPKLDLLLELSWQRLQMLRKYKPSKINSRIILYKARTLLSEYKSINDENNYWTKYVNNKVLVHHVSGNHETMLNNIKLNKLVNLVINDVCNEGEVNGFI